MEWWKNLEVVDKAQVISAGSAAIAAILAFITTLQNRNSIEKQKEERHIMTRPTFVVISAFETHIGKVQNIKVKNIGYSILNDITAKWEGIVGLSLKVNKYLEEDNTVSYTIVFRFDDIDDDINTIDGQLTLIYVDIWGKEYNESINVTFNKVFHSIYKKDYFKIKNINGESFI